MKEKQITITGLVFTLDGKRVGRGSVITGGRESLEQSLLRGTLQMGKIAYEKGAPDLPVNHACSAVLEGRGEYWLTLAPRRFLLREVPSLKEEQQKA